MNSTNSAAVNILYISHLSELHGAERVLLLHMENINRERFNPFVVLPTDGPLRDRLNEIDIPTYIVPMKPWICPSGLSEERFIFSLATHLKDNISVLINIIKEKKIDIVQTNTSTIIDGAIASALTSTSHIWHIHEILRDSPSFKDTLKLEVVYDAISSLSSRVVSVSRAVDSQFKNIPLGKRCVIYNGIDMEKYAGGASSGIREELDLKRDVPLVFSVGSIIETKGYRYLVEAIPGVISRCGVVHFIIVGAAIDGALYGEIRSSIEKMGIGKYVSFMGCRNDIPKILRDADLFIMPSVREAFPLSLLEAMASGKPVVATRCGGPEEMVVEGETGYLVSPRSADAIEDTIVKMLKDRERARYMGENGRRRVRESFGLDTFIKRWEELHKDVLADTPTKSPNGREVAEIILDLFKSSGNKGLNLVRRNEQLEGLLSKLRRTSFYKLYKLLRRG